MLEDYQMKGHKIIIQSEGFTPKILKNLKIRQIGIIMKQPINRLKFTEN